MWLHRPCRQSRNSSVECGRGFSFDMAPVVLSWPHRSNPCCVSGITEDPSSVPELCLFSYLSECELLDKTKVQIDSKVSNLWMCLWKEKKQDSRLNVIVMCAVIFEILYPVLTGMFVYTMFVFLRKNKEFFHAVHCAVETVYCLFSCSEQQNAVWFHFITLIYFRLNVHHVAVETTDLWVCKTSIQL